MDSQTHSLIYFLSFIATHFQFSLIVQDDNEFLVALVQLYTHHEELRLYVRVVVPATGI